MASHLGFSIFAKDNKDLTPYFHFMQGFAAGLMLSISFLDLAHNALNSIGFLRGNLWVSYYFNHFMSTLPIV